VEIIYLQEKGRIPAEMKEQLTTGLLDGSAGIALADLTAEVASRVSAVYREQVPDMPDRIIAATALHLDLALITRDHQIKVSGINTIW
jgi:predicted nucleic acid-binding protein